MLDFMELKFRFPAVRWYDFNTALSFEPLSIEGIKKLKRIFEFFFSRLVNWHFFKLITSRKIGLLKLRNSADFLCMWIFFGRDRIIGI